MVLILGKQYNSAVSTAEFFFSGRHLINCVIIAVTAFSGLYKPEARFITLLDTQTVDFSHYLYIPSIVLYMSAFNPERHITNIDYKIVAALEKISEVFRVLLWSEAKEHKLSPIQMQLLIFLKYHNTDKHRRIAAMAKEFNMTKATISDSIKVLELKGLIQRTADSLDSRSFNFALTDQGQKLTGMIEHFTLPLDGAIATLSPLQKHVMYSAVLDLIYRLNQNGIISTQRMCYNCFYYKGDRDKEHHCNLMQRPLAFDELRFECPEHVIRKES